MNRHRWNRAWTATRSVAAILWLNATFYPATLLITLLFTIVGAPIVCLHALFVRDQRRVLHLIRRIISRYGSTVIRAAWPLVRVKYVDHAPYNPPPFIFAANHRAGSDAFLMAFLPFEVVQVVNIWPFRIPWIGFMARLAGYLSVRQMSIEQFCEKGRTLLDQCCSIVTFPEGTRSGSCRMGSFTSSAFHLAMRAKVNIAPISISGNERVPPRGSMLLRPARIQIHKLPALPPDEYLHLTTFQLKQLVRRRIQDHLDNLEAT